jgi:hypothetical protein
VDHYRRECELRDFRLASCSNFLLDLARSLGVPPQGLGQGVKTLRGQLKEALKQLDEGPGEAKREWLQQLEAQNQKLEQALTSMGDVLQQHTRRWATACNMLTKLEELASLSLYVTGQAYLDGLQTPDALLIMHLIQKSSGSVNAEAHQRQEPRGGSSEHVWYSHSGLLMGQEASYLRMSIESSN